MNRFGLSFIVVCIASLALLTGCDGSAEANRQDESSEPQPVAVTLAPTRIQSVQRSVSVVGTLYGDEETSISAKVAGRVIAIFQDVGDRVSAGAALAQIESIDYELAKAQRETALAATLARLGLEQLPEGDFDPTNLPTVVRAKRQAENAEARLRRGKTLFEQQPPLISEQDYADLETAYDVARSNYDVELLTARSTLAEALSKKSELDSAEQRLADTTVRAPEPASDQVQGPREYAVAERLVSVGEYVREGTPLFRLVADNPIKFRAQVPERYIGRVTTGQTVHVRTEAYTDSFTGQVARISPQVDPASRTFLIEVVVDNADGRLKPGAFARGEVFTHTDEDVLFVPQQAVQVFAGIRKVFTIKDGKAVEHTIETGVRDGDFIEVVKGMPQASHVVVTGMARLSTGTPVTVEE